MNSPEVEILLLKILEEIDAKGNEHYRLYGPNSYDYRCGMHDAGLILNKHTNIYKEQQEKLKALKK